MFALDMYHFYQPQAPICADKSTSSYQLCWETTSGISCRACFVGGALNGAGARLEAPVVITDPLKLEIRKTSLTEWPPGMEFHDTILRMFFVSLKLRYVSLDP